MTLHIHHQAMVYQRKTFAGYLKGLGLSLLFTILAFAVAQYKIFTGSGNYLVLALLAILQLISQCYYFLNLNTAPEGRENFYTFMFMVFIVAIVITGSLWIMYNLNYNMT